MRQRTTGISFSDIGEIIIAFSICSPKDVFNKKHNKKRIQSRVMEMIYKSSKSSATVNSTIHSLYFSDIGTFLDTAEAMTRFGQLMFLPYRLKYGVRGEDTITVKHVDTQDISNTFFFTNFVERAYSRFMTILDEEQKLLNETEDQTSDENIPETLLQETDLSDD